MRVARVTNEIVNEGDAEINKLINEPDNLSMFNIDVIDRLDSGSFT